MKIWIDNDACPRRVREIIFKAGKRLSLPVVVVANRYMHPPKGQDIQVVVVGSGFDAADDHIAEGVQSRDIVITEDVPLADRVITAGGVAISPRGRVFDQETIKEQLAMRNLRQELRSAGEIYGGPNSLADGDIAKFAAAFDRLVTALTQDR